MLVGRFSCFKTKVSTQLSGIVTVGMPDDETGPAPRLRAVKWLTSIVNEVNIGLPLRFVFLAAARPLASEDVTIYPSILCTIFRH